MQKTLKKILQLSKDSSTDLGKLRIEVEHLKTEGVHSVNKLIQQVKSFSAGVNASNNELAVSVQTGYSTFSQNTEKSYYNFCHSVINTLKYFLRRN